MSLLCLVASWGVIIFVILFIVFILNKIQDAKYEKAIEKLEELAYKDKMTGCYNRNWLEEHRAEFDTKEMEIALVDLNGLKKTNDTYGHENGDRRIRNLADALKNYGTVIRLGGDEFVVIFDKGKAMIFDACFTNYGVGDREFSYGMIIKSSMETFREALKIADKRMYKMKKELKGKGNEKRRT